MEEIYNPAEKLIRESGRRFGPIGGAFGIGGGPDIGPPDFESGETDCFITEADYTESETELTTP